MRSFSNEFLVGLLTIAVAVLVAWGFARTDDQPDGTDATRYILYFYVPSAEGIFRSTPVRLAGVPVGAVETIELDGTRARVTLLMSGAAKLPADSTGELKSEGILGDKFIRVGLGSASIVLEDGDTLAMREGGPGLDDMTAKADAIADDVKAITASLREVLSDPELRGQLKSTISNLDALARELREVAGENRSELAVIAENLRVVSETLARVVEATGASVEQEMAAVRKATETLDRTIGHLESIAAKADRGEGTVGKLLNDSSTIDSINATLDEVNGVVGAVSRIRTDVYYRGDIYFGSIPSDDAYGGINPVAGLTRNVVGVRVRPREDYWYLVEIVSHPIGSITHEDHVLPDIGMAYREYVVTPDYRFSFQFAKRWHDLVVRFGVKESSGGIGADWLLLRDHIQLSADVYDFGYAAWPNMDGAGIPNVQLTARAMPWRNVYFEGGLDNVVLGARYGYVTGFAGGGFTFDDQDLKYVLAVLPFSP